VNTNRETTLKPLIMFLCKSVISYKAVNKIYSPVIYNNLPLDVSNPFSDN
jgi:hypothetical protein